MTCTRVDNEQSRTSGFQRDGCQVPFGADTGKTPSKGYDNKMMGDPTSLGLRLFEFEIGLSENIEDARSAELVDYDVSRIAGQAARLAMVVRGQDIIEDEQTLKKLVAHGLGISPADYREAKRWLMDADLIEEAETRAGKRVLIEKIERLNHSENYQRIGAQWSATKQRTPKEEALIYTLERVVEQPSAIRDLDALGNLGNTERKAVLEVGENAGVLDVLEQQGLYYSPMLWDVDPKKLEAFLGICDTSAFRSLLEDFRKRPGTDITAKVDQVLLQAVSGGIVPSYRVRGTGGARHYGFAPYTGNLLSSTAEKGILDKARALVASLRYGKEAATITRIRNAQWILSALMDSARQYRVGPHSELKGQYGMLVAKQIGRLRRAKQSSRFYFELIPTTDNLRACQLALELLTEGEALAHKDPAAISAVHLGTASVNHPLREVRVARKKRAARADELAGIIEGLQTV